MTELPHPADVLFPLPKRYRNTIRVHPAWRCGSFLPTPDAPSFAVKRAFATPLGAPGRLLARTWLGDSVLTEARSADVGDYLRPEEAGEFHHLVRERMEPWLRAVVAAVGTEDLLIEIEVDVRSEREPVRIASLQHHVDRTILEHMAIGWQGFTGFLPPPPRAPDGRLDIPEGPRILQFGPRPFCIKRIAYSQADAYCEAIGWNWQSEHAASLAPLVNFGLARVHMRLPAAHELAAHAARS